MNNKLDLLEIHIYIFFDWIGEHRLRTPLFTDRFGLSLRFQ